jgi:hypothetical protein
MTLREGFATLKVDKKKRTLVLKELMALDTEKITAGVHSAEGRQVVGDNGFRLIDVAVQNEYGNQWEVKKNLRFFKNDRWWFIKKGTIIKIPATRFVSRVIQAPIERRNLIDQFKAEMHILIKYGNGGTAYTARQVVRNIGTYMRDRIRKGIDDKIFMSNSPMTIAMKGFDKRLFEKGTLYKAIKFKSKKAKVQG